MKRLNKKNAFTLVELIIVITILAILATIWFMSFQSYTNDARDWKRKRDLASIRSGLEMYQAKKAILPMPDNYATLSSWTTIWYQWYAWPMVLWLIKAWDSFQDPTDKWYYTYWIDVNKTKYQLLAMLEQNPNSTSYNYNLVNQTYAIDYTNRYSYTLWKWLWIYLSWSTKSPVQEWNSWTTVTVNTANISVVTSNTSNVSGWNWGAWSTPVNWVCWSANGTTVATRPTTNLCWDGFTPTVSWTWPWTWTCNWSNLGTNASCSASKILNTWDTASSSGSEIAIYAWEYNQTWYSSRKLWLAQPTNLTFAYKTDNTSTLNASDVFDGRNNTGTFDSSHPASYFCQNLVRAWYNDWYLPALNKDPYSTDCNNPWSEMRYLYCKKRSLNFQHNTYLSSTDYSAWNDALWWYMNHWAVYYNWWAKTNATNIFCIRVAN